MSKQTALSSVMAAALDLATRDGALVYRRGGYWTASAATEGASSSPWGVRNVDHFPTQTIDALVLRGRLKVTGLSRVTHGYRVRVEPTE